MKQFLLAQFDFNHRLYNNALDGFTDEETNQRLYGDTRINHVKYIAGHLLNSQYAFALLAETPVDWKWNDFLLAEDRRKPAMISPTPPFTRLLMSGTTITNPPEMVLKSFLMLN